jgi:hypothetical protein
MKSFDRIKEWAKTLNFDPTWKEEIDKINNLEELDQKVSNFIAEIGWTNVAGFYALFNKDPVKEKIEKMLDLAEPLQFLVRDLEPLISADNKHEIDTIKECVAGLVGNLRNLHCFEEN